MISEAGLVLLKQRVRKVGNCWAWPLKPRQGRMTFGYLCEDGTRRWFYPERELWQGEHGEIPDGMRLSSSCDNPSCIRPLHRVLLPIRTYPIEPLVELVGGKEELGRRLGFVDASSLDPGRRLSEATADKWAILCGHMAHGVWPEWTVDQDEDAELLRAADEKRMAIDLRHLRVVA